MFVYLATNKINGKRYVGITIRSLEDRIATHLTSRKGVFPKALRKYGLQSFEFSTIDTADDYNILQEKEKYWISYYNCKVPGGYNLTDGGEGTVGYKHTQKSKKKISDAGKGRITLEETRKKLSDSGKGHIVSDETRKKISDAQKGKKGWVHSDEARKKMSDARKGKSNGREGTHHSGETKRKISEALKGKKYGPLSEETKRKLSEATRRVRAQDLKEYNV